MGIGIVRNKAIVLVSGGLDSATILRLAVVQGYEIYVLSFNYGQKHLVELDMAKKLVVSEGQAVIEHKLLNLESNIFGSSSLVDENVAVPKDRNMLIQEKKPSIPNTYVPARNTIFLSYAMAYAEVKQANHIFMGANAIDYSGYPDCRPEYIRAFQTMANLGSAMGSEGDSIHIHAPLLYLNKAQIISLGIAIGAHYHDTISCYDPYIDKISGKAKSCARCDACQLRLNGFRVNDRSDVIEYI